MQDIHWKFEDNDSGTILCICVLGGNRCWRISEFLLRDWVKIGVLRAFDDTPYLVLAHSMQLSHDARFPHMVLKSV